MFKKNTLAIRRSLFMFEVVAKNDRNYFKAKHLSRYGVVERERFCNYICPNNWHMQYSITTLKIYIRARLSDLFMQWYITSSTKFHYYRETNTKYFVDSFCVRYPTIHHIFVWVCMYFNFSFTFHSH